MQFLLFTLYAPMASFGEIAVGERRMSWPRPARSQVLGLVASALGITRVDEQEHVALERALGYGVRTDAPGRPLVDYHTAQTPRARRGQAFKTRRDELQAPQLATVLSTREWRIDSFFTVALWSRPGAQADLARVEGGLLNPRYALYLGRKAAPLGLPLNPLLAEADSIVDALSARAPSEMEREVLTHVRPAASENALIACDMDAPGVPGEIRQERRRDAVSSRARWQFSDRTEAVFVSDKGRA